MIIQGKNYNLVHKLDVNGYEYAIFNHPKSHRNSLWHFKTGGWQRIGDIYDVAMLLVYIRRVESTRLTSGIAKAIGSVLGGMVAGAMLYHFIIHAIA